MRPAVAAAAVALLLAAGCARGRSDATAADAVAACQAYYDAKPDQVGRVSNLDEVRRRAKPLRRSDYDTLGSELVRFVTHQGMLRQHVEDGNGDKALKEAEEMGRIMGSIDEECRALDASPTPLP